MTKQGSSQERWFRATDRMEDRSPHVVRLYGACIRLTDHVWLRVDRSDNQPLLTPHGAAPPSLKAKNRVTSFA